MLIRYTPDVREIAAQALAAPVSLKDTQAVRVLLDAGADPRRYRDDDGHPASAIMAAIAAGCDLELIGLPLTHGANPNELANGSRSAYAVAMANGRADLVELLARHGARDDATPLDRLSYACLAGERATALRLLEQHPALRSELARADGCTLIRAAENGDVQAIERLIAAGFPVAAAGRFDPAGTDGVTALHAAAWAGSATAAERLLAAGANVNALDGQWQGTPPSLSRRRRRLPSSHRRITGTSSPNGARRDREIGPQRHVLTSSSVVLGDHRGERHCYRQVGRRRVPTGPGSGTSAVVVPCGRVWPGPVRGRRRF